MAKKENKRQTMRPKKPTIKVNKVMVATVNLAMASLCPPKTIYVGTLVKANTMIYKYTDVHIFNNESKGKLNKNKNRQ